MAFNDFAAESPTNYSQKSICCFVVDVSGSMNGAPIQQLNQGLQEFHHDIQNDSATADRLEIAIVEFSSFAEVVLEPALVDNFAMPMLQTKGTTAMVDGVRKGIELVVSRKEWYKKTGQPYLRPWIVLITDGVPDSGQDVKGLTREIEQATKGKEFVFLPIGVDGADMRILQDIAGYSQDADKNWIKMTPMKLQGLQFSAFFQWVSASMSIVAGSKDGDKIDLPAPTWMDGFSI